MKIHKNGDNSLNVFASWELNIRDMIEMERVEGTL